MLPFCLSCVEAVFNLEEYKITMADLAVGEYTSGCNMWWVNPFALITTGVPYNHGQIRRLQDYFFSRPTTKFPLNITVAVSNEDDPNSLKGNFLSLTPLEPIHALLLRVAADVEGGADTEDLKTWRRLMLTVSITFERVGSEDDRHWRAVQLREAVGAKHAVMSRTPIARVYELMEYKKKVEAKSGSLAAATLADYYMRKGHLNELSEKVTKSWVDTACTVFDRMLSCPQIKEIITMAENEYGVKTPFQSIYTLECILCKARDEGEIAWTLASLLFGLHEDMYSLADITQRRLTGKGQGGKGLVDVAMFRKRFGIFVAFTWVEKHEFDIEVKTAIRRMLKDHTEYAAMMGTAQQRVDITWVSLLAPSGQQLVRIVEAHRPSTPWRSIPVHRQIICIVAKAATTITSAQVFGSTAAAMPAQALDQDRQPLHTEANPHHGGQSPSIVVIGVSMIVICSRLWFSKPITSTRS